MEKFEKFPPSREIKFKSEKKYLIFRHHAYFKYKWVKT